MLACRRSHKPITCANLNANANANPRTLPGGTKQETRLKIDRRQTELPPHLRCAASRPANEKPEQYKGLAGFVFGALMGVWSAAADAEMQRCGGRETRCAGEEEKTRAGRGRTRAARDRARA